MLQECLAKLLLFDKLEPAVQQRLVAETYERKVLVSPPRLMGHRQSPPPLPAPVQQRSAGAQSRLGREGLRGLATSTTTAQLQRTLTHSHSLTAYITWLCQPAA